VREYAVVMITEIGLDNFLSFPLGTKIPLKKLSVIIWPNNSGKSNFFAAIRGLALAHKSQWNSFAKYLQSPFAMMVKSGEKVFNLSVEGSELGASKAKFRYQVQFHNVADSPQFTEMFIAYLSDKDESSPIEKHNAPKVMQPTSNLLYFGSFPAGDTQMLSSFREVLGGIRHFRFSPDALRAPTAIVQNPDLRDDGLGIPAVLDQLQSEFPLAYGQLQDDFRKCVPEMEHVLLRTADQGTKRIIFKERGYEQPFLSTQVSEGILILLALLTVVHSPRKPSIILIEDIETGVHPRRLSEIVDILRAFSANSNVQILLSTHSPYLLDFFKEDLEAVLVFEKNDKGTSVKTGKSIVDSIGGLHGSPLGEAWYTGILGGVPA
jgi:predicted ATPase